MTAASVTAAALCVLATLALASAEDLQVPALQSPEGPPQFCRDDAGPPWNDDGETYPGARYHDGAPATPVLPASGECPAPQSLLDALAGGVAFFSFFLLRAMFQRESGKDVFSFFRLQDLLG